MGEALVGSVASEPSEAERREAWCSCRRWAVQRTSAVTGAGVYAAGRARPLLLAERVANDAMRVEEQDSFDDDADAWRTTPAAALGSLMSEVFGYKAGPSACELPDGVLCQSLVAKGVRYTRQRDNVRFSRGLSRCTERVQRRRFDRLEQGFNGERGAERRSLS